jgi:hypothetical protein
MNGKKGDVNWVVIMLVLGIIVLVVLAMGFLGGWNKLLPWISSENVGETVTQCSVACTQGSVYNWCTKNRTINDGDKAIATDVTCQMLATETEYSDIGVKRCTTISCESSD